jgi:hypothetical protein
MNYHNELTSNIENNCIKRIKLRRHYNNTVILEFMNKKMGITLDTLSMMVSKKKPTLNHYITGKIKMNTLVQENINRTFKYCLSRLEQIKNNRDDISKNDLSLIDKILKDGRALEKTKGKRTVIAKPVFMQAR